MSGLTSNSVERETANKATIDTGRHQSLGRPLCLTDATQALPCVACLRQYIQKSHQGLSVQLLQIAEGPLNLKLDLIPCLTWVLQILVT